MQTVVLAAGKRTQLRLLTGDKPKMCRSRQKPILTHYFDQFVDLGAEKLVVVDYKKMVIIEHYDEGYRGVSITYTHQHEEGTRSRASYRQDHIDEDFMLGENILEANLDDVVNQQCRPAPMPPSSSSKATERMRHDTASV